MRNSIWSDHFPLLLLHAALLSAFLALLWRDTRRERLRLFAKLFAALVGCALLVAWTLARIQGR